MFLWSTCLNHYHQCIWCFKSLSKYKYLYIRVCCARGKLILAYSNVLRNFQLFFPITQKLNKRLKSWGTNFAWKNPSYAKFLNFSVTHKTLWKCKITLHIIWNFPKKIRVSKFHSETWKHIIFIIIFVIIEILETHFRSSESNELKIMRFFKNTALNFEILLQIRLCSL